MITDGGGEEINKRRLDILIIVLDRRAINVKELSKKFNVTRRTIQEDLKIISNFTKKYWDFNLATTDGLVNCGENNNLSKFRIYNQLDFNNYTLNKDERILVEYLILSTSNNFITYTDISEIVYVSRSTIVEDQYQLGGLLKSYDVDLDAKAGYGIRISGNELSIRSIYTIIVTEYIYLICMYFNSNYFKSNLSKADIDDNLKAIDNIIGDIEYNNSIIFDDNSFAKLRYLLEFIIVREKMGFSLYDIKGYESSNKLGFQIYDNLVKLFNFDYSSNEKVFISHFVDYLGFKNINLNDNVQLSVQFLTRKLIGKLSESLELPLYLDYKLFESLSMHLDRISNKPIYKINDYNIDLNNYFYDNSYVDKVYDAVKSTVFILEDYFKRNISDSEITFIVIYVCASIERIKYQKAKELSILVICNYGIGTSELIKLQLEEMFSFKEIEVTSSHQLDRLDIKQIDLILSTTILNNEQINYLKVSPVLTTDDYEHISNEILKKISFTNIKSRKHTNIYKVSDEKKNKSKGIDNYLTHDFINIVEDVYDWKESIKIAAKPLVSKGFIDEEYIQRMIGNIQKNGPYVVINKGFALPHADKTGVVKKTSFSFLKLRKPVIYNAGEMDPVKYICVLAVNENEDHTKALFELVNLFQVDSFNNELNEANTVDEIEKIIFKYAKINHN